MRPFPYPPRTSLERNPRPSDRIKKDGRSRRELDNQLQVPQNEVAPLRRVEVAEGSNAAPSEQKIGEVALLPRAGSGPEVEGGSSPNTVREEGLGAKAGNSLERLVPE